MTNSSGRYSPYPSCFIRPDGIIVRQLRPNQAGSMVNIVDLSKEFYDPMAPFRNMAVNDALTNGPETIADPRSGNTTIL